MKKLYLFTFTLVFVFSGFQLMAANHTQQKADLNVKTVSLKFDNAQELSKISWDKIRHIFDKTAPDQTIEIKIVYTGADLSKNATMHSFSLDARDKMSHIDAMINDLKRTVISLQKFVKK